jgi:predicted phage gp36 major capsid-like protein
MGRREKMGRPRKYRSNAERQRAWRERLDAEMVRVQRASLERVEGQLERLQRAVAAAAQAGDETARSCRCEVVEGVLEKLIRHFEGRARKSEEELGGNAPAGVDTGSGHLTPREALRWPR